jgi:hypothetical protein
MLVETLKILAAMLFGGVGGALLNEYFRRKRTKTQTIPLIERVNRNPVGSELRGIKLVRVSGNPNEPPIEIKNIREYQLTLRNTSDRDLRGAEIQFEFSSEDVEPWVSRAALSKTSLIRVDGHPAEAWKKALRWQIPQFPRGDSVEFSFQAVDPSSEAFEVCLYNVDNVVIQRTQGEPPETAGKLYHWLSVMVVGTAISTPLLGIVAYNVGYYWSGRQHQSESTSLAPVSAKSPDELEISRIITESQKFKYTTLFVNPSAPQPSQVAAFWVPEDKGGTAVTAVHEVLQRLVKNHLKYGPGGRVDQFRFIEVRLLSAEFARTYISELWFLPVYSEAGGVVQACSPIFEPAGTYELRKIDGRWLIQSEPSMENLPDACAHRLRANREHPVKN